MKLLILFVVFVAASFAQCPSMTFELVNVKSNLAVSVSNGSTAQGANLIQWPFKNAASQQFTLIPLNGLYVGLTDSGSFAIFKCDNGTASLFWTAPNFADAETPVGAVDAKNRVFTLAHVPSNTPVLVLDGVVLREGGDFTRDGSAITFSPNAYFPSRDTDIFQAWYRY